MGGRTATERVTGFLAQLLNGVQALQVAGAEDAAVVHFHQLSQQRRQPWCATPPLTR
ncbi:MAG: hypothetical protein R3A44_41920 [Caldilineaceae bacterium]